MLNMSYILSVWVFLFVGFATAFCTDPDCSRNASEIIAAKGYPVEEYDVVTADGYILTIQRIPGKRGSNPIKGAPSASDKVVFIQHGLLSSSIDWIVNEPTESLGFIMADKGYDVWLGNVRGNTYGRRHKTLNPSDKKFWQFSYDEFIQYDIPSMIDYALNVSGQPSLYYVGHSQGTMVMFGLLSERPEYHDKIRAFGALAPVANLTSITSPLRYLAPLAMDTQAIFDLLGEDEFLPNSPFMRFLANTVCRFFLSEELCKVTIFVIAGYNAKEMNTTRIPVYVCHMPAGTSVRNMVHFAQGIESGQFRKYDFGEEGNIKAYGQPQPPDYDVRKVGAPVMLLWGQNDWLADPVDVDDGLADRIPNATVYKIPDDDFTHQDFLWGIHANQLVYPKMFEFFDQH